MNVTPAERLFQAKTTSRILFSRDSSSSSSFSFSRIVLLPARCRLSSWPWREHLKTILCVTFQNAFDRGSLLVSRRRRRLLSATSRWHQPPSTSVLVTKGEKKSNGRLNQRDNLHAALTPREKMLNDLVPRIIWSSRTKTFSQNYG